MLPDVPEALHKRKHSTCFLTCGSLCALAGHREPPARNPQPSTLNPINPSMISWDALMSLLKLVVVCGLKDIHPTHILLSNPDHGVLDRHSAKRTG